MAITYEDIVLAEYNIIEMKARYLEENGWMCAEERWNNAKQGKYNFGFEDAVHTQHEHDLIKNFTLDPKTEDE